MKNNKILVTKTFLPPLEEYTQYLKEIWDSRWITNHGKFALELEEKLKRYLDVKHVIFVSNATIALQISIKSLELQGEIITTPFSFVATTTSILWERCKPVFVDIDSNTFCIDVNKIEKAITKNTKAILAVHVYGYPCNVKAIEEIAKKHNLKVIYDAAHAFGVKINGKSIFKFGDISVLSLHATKLFHTGEGGLVITENDALAEKIKLMRDFGLEGEQPIDIGINAKNSELHAAMGLANFKYINEIRSARKNIIDEYKKLLSETNIHKTKYYKNIEYNFAYFPVILNSEKDLLKVKEALEKENIFPRRYFYPSLNTLPFVKYCSCPISESVSKKVLCLPLYHDLDISTVKKITEIIKATLQNSKPTLAIGITAYKEENNIGYLIRSILSQLNNNYILKEIIVNSDASGDKTILIVRELSKKDARIKIIGSNSRMGKACRLKEIYFIHNSDYILTLDGDVILKDYDTIDNMINIFIKDEKACVVAGNLIPIKPKSFVGNISYINDLAWRDIRKNINNGDHIANLYGGACMLRKDFSKLFIYPTHLRCDQEYLYVKAKDKNGFRYAKKACFLFKTPETLSEIIHQGKLALNERYPLEQFFGEEILKLHKIPFKNKIKGIIKMIIYYPLYAPFSIWLSLIVRIWPYEDKLNKNGM